MSESFIVNAEKSSNLKLYHYLAFAGTIPFILSPVALIYGVEKIVAIGTIADILMAYALTILSFMSGIYWGQYLAAPEQKLPFNLPILSNFLTLMGWGVYLALPLDISLILFVILFAILVFIDYILRREDVISQAYFKMRVFVTLIVCISLLAFEVIQ